MAEVLSATIELTQSLDPRQRLKPEQATVRMLPDSSVVPVVSVLPKPVDDSLHRPRDARDTTAADSARADTARARRPGIAEVEGVPPAAGVAPGRAELKPLTSRPALTDMLVLRVARPWRPGARYEVEIRGLRSVSGVAADVKGVLAVPAAVAPDSTARGADSLKRRPTKKRP